MSDEVEARLDELAARIERVAIAPAEVAQARPWMRVAKPFFKLFRWRPKVRTRALRALLAELREANEKAPDRSRLGAAREAALVELGENIAAAERASIVDGASAHGPLAGWLTRLHEVTARAARAASDPENDSKLRVALALDAPWAITPLALRDSSARAADSAEADAADEGREAESTESAAGPGTSAERPAALDEENDPRLVEVELAAIDRVLDAARAETHFLGRRRRLFEAARKLLLDASAALPLDPEAVHARAQHIADEITLANRWEAAGVDRDVALPYQAVSAVTRGERQRLYATLRAAFALATVEGNAPLVARAGDVLRRLDLSDADGAEAGGSTERSASEILGDEPVRVMREAYVAAQRELGFRKLAPPASEEDAADLEQRAQLWERYLGEDAVLATLSAAISVDGCFEVGGTLAPVRVEEETRRLRVVPYPTQDLVLAQAREVADLPNALIDDPRGILLALAEGRLLTRHYQRVDTVRTPRTRLQSEARIYVLDGSDSMFVGPGGRKAGARARMRDAILLAELSTLYRRTASAGRSTRVVLFYRYFTKLLGDVVRVSSAPEALHAMAEVVQTPRHGGTNIEAALLASFEQIRQARAADPDLSRAQIVLVTDGNATVDESAVRAAREREGALPIAVSVIALGEENPVLRRLVARQRARGEQAFYHFMSDADLTAIVGGERAAGSAVHRSGGATAASAEHVEALSEEVRALVDEIEALDRSRLEAPAGARSGAASGMGTADADALAALGMRARDATEGERARREVRERDERALARRFDAWFPVEGAALDGAARASEGAIGDGGPEWTSDVEASLVVLATLADVLADLGGTLAERRADAIELLERLLPDARLAPARYLAVLRARPAPVVRALEALRAAVSGSTQR